MNYNETRTYLERHLVKLGWQVRLDKADYKKIFQFTRGQDDRLDQFYYKLVSVGSRQPKREITDGTVSVAIDDLNRMEEIVEQAKLNGKSGPQSRTELDRYSIDQLAKALETEVALEEKQARIADEKFPKVEPIPSEPESAAGNLPRILVVDDSSTIRAAVTKSLKNDFSFVQAADGEQAWKILKSDDSIQLVVTDLMMPNLDGYGLIQRIRTDRNSPRISQLPIIVVTTLEDANAKLRALMAGANDFVTKGTDAIELRMRVMARYKVAQSTKGAGQYASGSHSAVPAQASASTTPTPATAIPPTAARSSHAAPSAAANANASAPPPQGAAVSRSGATASASAPKSGVSATAGTRPQDSRTVRPELRGPGSATTGKMPPSMPDRSLGDGSDGWLQIRDWFAKVTPLTAITVGATVMVVIVIALIIAINGPKRNVPQAMSGTSVIETASDTPTDAGASATSSPPTVATSSDSSGGAGTQAARNSESSKISSSSKVPDRSAVAKKERAPEEVVAAANRAPDRVESTKTQTADKPPVVAAPGAKELAQTTEVVAAVTTGKTPAVAAADAKTTVEASAAAPAQAPPKSNAISQAELATLIKRFEFVYEAGDIEQFLRIFDDDVRTNDRFSKDGLREDYEDLFKTTEMRRMTLKNVTWEAHDNKADGWGNFEVVVRKVGEQEIKEYKGSLTFYVEKINGQLRIKRLYHGQWRAS